MSSTVTAVHSVLPTFGVGASSAGLVSDVYHIRLIHQTSVLCVRLAVLEGVSEELHVRRRTPARPDRASHPGQCQHATNEDRAIQECGIHGNLVRADRTTDERKRSAIEQIAEVECRIAQSRCPIQNSGETTVGRIDDDVSRKQVAMNESWRTIWLVRYGRAFREPPIRPRRRCFHCRYFAHFPSQLLEQSSATLRARGNADRLGGSNVYRVNACERAADVVRKRRRAETPRLISSDVLVCRAAVGKPLARRPAQHAFGYANGRADMRTNESKHALLAVQVACHAGVSRKAKDQTLVDEIRVVRPP